MQIVSLFSVIYHELVQEMSGRYGAKAIEPFTLGKLVEEEPVE
jgi:hypothetical protein